MAAGKRKENESFKDYRVRLSDKAKTDALAMAGSPIWFATRGTYVKAKHGPIGSRP